MQLADSDAGLYALGVGGRGGLDAEVTLPDVHPMQVQGPLSAKTLEKLVGPAIYDIKYYWTERFEIDGIPVVISRTGWTAIPGFEVNLLDGTRGRRPVERGRRGRRGVRHPPDRAVRGAADRGRHLQLRLGHPARRHAAPRDGARAPRRGAAAGLHRQGGARGAPSQRASTASSWASSSRATSCAPRCPSTGTSSRDGQEGRAHDRRRVVAGAGEEHRLRLGADRARRAGHELDVETEDGDHIAGSTAAIPFVDPRRRSRRQARCRR